MIEIEVKDVSKPKSNDIIELADYVELLCICETIPITLNDVCDKIFKSLEVEADEESEESAEVFEVERGVSQAEKYDKHLQFVEDIFSHLEYRQAIFAGFYPFKVRAKQIEFSVANAAIDNQKKIYIFLLMCSSLRIFGSSTVSLITSLFEVLSTVALEEYLPSFTVHAFGKSEKARKQYPCKLGEAVKLLSINLCERDICDYSEIKDKNTGDGGLDIVAWKSIGGEAVPGKLICFAQCACSESEWHKKSYDAHEDKWRHRIDFIHTPANMLFIPFCYRKTSGEWYLREKLASSIVFDRYRICMLLNAVNKLEGEINQSVDIFITTLSRN